MKLSIYQIVYIVMNIFRTFLIFKYISIFYHREGVNKRVEVISYIGFYLFITLLYLVVNIPIIMLLSNLIGIIILSLNYKSNLKKRLLSTILIYIILLCAESIISLLTGYVNFPIFSKNYYSSIFGIVSIQLLSYAIVLILQNFKKIKSGKTVTTSYWVGILTIPMATLYIIIILFYVTGLGTTHLLLCITFLLLINIITFSFYDKTLDIIENRLENQLLLQQNNYYEKQFELMKTSITTTRSIHHDFVNHLHVIRTLSQKYEIDKIKEYLTDLQIATDTGKDYVNSGNLIIDSIINFKIQEAKQKNINIQIELSVPEKISITSFDMTVVLGNLLDNAMNAVSKLDESKRKITMEIQFVKSILLIRINNHFDGNICYKGDQIISTHTDRLNHGIGLSNVKSTVEKYHGKLNITYTNEVFCVEVMLYINNA